MTQQLRALAAFSEDPGSASSIHIRQLSVTPTEGILCPIASKGCCVYRVLINSHKYTQRHIKILLADNFKLSIIINDTNYY